MIWMNYQWLAFITVVWRIKTKNSIPNTKVEECPEIITCASGSSQSRTESARDPILEITIFDTVSKLVLYTLTTSIQGDLVSLSS
jgi:hypothetical protein